MEVRFEHVKAAEEMIAKIVKAVIFSMGKQGVLLMEDDVQVGVVN